jgi:hypothetical protein
MVAMNKLISVHAPSTQASPGTHATPQLPQLRNDVRKSTHPEPHWMKLPQLSRHVPWVHCWPPAQAMPQAPQLFWSPLIFAERPVQSSMTPPAAKLTHFPFWQIVSAGQALPGAPQLRALDWKLSHTPSTTW